VISRKRVIYRGKDCEGNWRNGEYYIKNGKHFIVTYRGIYQVDPKTVERIEIN